MKLPEEGFRFNCGFDICTYPIQYCDTGEDRCVYCSEDVCRSDSIPDQCTVECYSLLSSTTQVTEYNDVQTTNVPVFLENALVGVYVIAIVALVLVLMLIMWIFIGRKMRKKDRNTQGGMYKPVVHTILAETPQPTTVTLNKDDKELLVVNNTGKEEKEQPTAPEAESYSDATIVTHPDEEISSRSHNFGEHNIMPSNMDDQPKESQSNGPLSQAENDKNCEKMDHEILNNSTDFGTNITNNKHKVNGIDNMNTCTEYLGFGVNMTETLAKEGPPPTNKLCYSRLHI